MKYMVTIHFRPEDRAAIMPLIPAEREHVQQLREQGQLEAIYVSAAGAPVWIVMIGETEDQVRSHLEGFPLYAYMEFTVAQLV